MYDEFTKIEKIYGNVFIDDKNIGETYYEFTYNPFKTDEMKILLVNPPFSIMVFFNKEIKDIYVKTQFQNTLYTISLNFRLYKYESTLKNTTISCPVKEFNIERILNKEKDESYIYLGFYFPLTALTNTEDGQIKHSDYGLIRGDYNFETEEISLKKEDYFVNTGLGKFKITDEYKFFDLPSTELYYWVNVLKRSICSIRLPFDSDKYERDILNVLEFVEYIFSLISLLERDRINWTSRYIRIHNHNDNIDKTIETFRWCSPVSKNYYKTRTDFEKRKKTFELMVHSFEALSAEERLIILELIKNIEIANCSKTIETKLIHLHSCLDFFRKKYNKKSSSFSKDLITLLDENQINVSDLILEDVLGSIRNSIKNKSTFKFTQLRNSYIHEGFDAFEGNYDSVMRENKIMLSKCERFILNRMGINYTDTVLGIVK
ncbi:MAG: hypothetical protein C4517_17985 [Stygiobacter sp.]|nr:MAG: hypothetical protein C4517_17985 [Stygiobacter sp.]